MIKNISRSGYVTAKKENGYTVTGQLSEELLQTLFDFVEGLESPQEVADRLILENASEEQALLFIDMYPFWGEDKDYGIKDGVKDRVKDFDEAGVLRLYQIITPHKSQADWRPYMTPNLWLDLSHHEVIGGEYPEWKQPTGAHDAYKIGDIVWHKEKLWICTEVDGAGNNSWEPGVYGWEIWQVQSQQND